DLGDLRAGGGDRVAVALAVGDRPRLGVGEQVVELLARHLEQPGHVDALTLGLTDGHTNRLLLPARRPTRARRLRGPSGCSGADTTPRAPLWQPSLTNLQPGGLTSRT